MATSHDLVATPGGWTCRGCGLSGPLGVAAAGPCGGGGRPGQSPTPYYQRGSWWARIAVVVVGIAYLLIAFEAGLTDYEVVTNRFGWSEVVAVTPEVWTPARLAVGAAVAAMGVAAWWMDRPAEQAEKAHKAAERATRMAATGTPGEAPARPPARYRRWTWWVSVAGWFGCLATGFGIVALWAATGANDGTGAPGWLLPLLGLAFAFGSTGLGATWLDSDARADERAVREAQCRRDSSP